jgi:hypothetical protein
MHRYCRIESKHDTVSDQDKQTCLAIDTQILLPSLALPLLLTRPRPAALGLHGGMARARSPRWGAGRSREDPHWRRSGSVEEMGRKSLSVERECMSVTSHASTHAHVLVHVQSFPPPPPSSLLTFPRNTERKQCLHFPPTCKSQTAISFAPAATNNNGRPAGEGEVDGTYPPPPSPPASCGLCGKRVAAARRWMGPRAECRQTWSEGGSVEGRVVGECQVMCCKPRQHSQSFGSSFLIPPLPQVILSFFPSFPFSSPSSPYLDKKEEAQVEKEEVAPIRPTRQPGLSVRAYFMYEDKVCETYHVDVLRCLCRLAVGKAHK